MKRIAMRRVVLVGVLGVASIGLTGCEDKEALEEIEVLKEEAEMLELDYENEKKRVRESRESMQALRQEMNELEGEKRSAEQRLKIAERELGQYKKREESSKAARENAPTRKEMAVAGKKAAEESLGALVTIKGEGTTGSGFLVKADEKTWLYFSPRALGGSKKLEISQSGGGTLAKFGVFELAEEGDLARLEVLDEVENALSLGDSSALESGAALFGVGEEDLLEEGRFYGSEGTIIKGDSRLARCVPGTPVLGGANAALIGMTVAENAAKRELWPKSKSTSRAGRTQINRLDRKMNWTEATMGTFLEDAKIIADADRLTRLVVTFAEVRPSEEGLNLDTKVGGGMSAKELLEENEELSAVRSLYELDEWLQEKGSRVSGTARLRKVRGPYEEMLRLSTRHTTTFGSRKFLPYHQKIAEQSMEWRKEAEEKLSEVIKNQE